VKRGKGGKGKRMVVMDECFAKVKEMDEAITYN